MAQPDHGFTLVAADPPAKLPAPRRYRRAWSTPWPWAVLAVILVVAGTLTGPQPGPVVDPWGYVPDLHAEPVQTWERRTPADAFWVFSRAVVTQDRHAITGFDPATGQELWQIEAEEPRCASDGVDLTCTTGPDTVEIIGPQSGRSRQYAVPDLAVATNIGDDLIAVTAHDIRRVSVGGEVEWSSDAADHQRIDAGPEVLDGMVLMTLTGRSEPTRVLDAATGRAVAVPDAGASPAPVRDGLWTSRLDDAAWLHARDDPALLVNGWVSWWVAAEDPSMIRAIDDKERSRWLPIAFLPDVTIGFLAAQEHGPGTMIAQDPESRDELWRAEPNGRMVDPPLLGPETFLYSTSADLVALDVHTGSTRWTITPPDVIRDFISDGERLYVLDDTGLSGWDLS